MLRPYLKKIILPCSLSHIDSHFYKSETTILLNFYYLNPTLETKIHCYSTLRCYMFPLKMEKARCRSLLIVCLVLAGILVGQSAASFKSCYKDCFNPCVVSRVFTAAEFATHCLAKCAKRPVALNNETNSHDFCKLGCAYFLCANISSKGDPSIPFFPFKTLLCSYVYMCVPGNS